MKFKNILWDWNGTLLNDVDICVEIVNGLLEAHGSDTFHKIHYKSIFGFPVSQYYEKAGFDFSKESFDSLAVKFIDSYNDAVMNCQLHANAQDTLQELHKKGGQQFILTAAYKESVIELLSHYNIDHFFRDIAGLDNIKAESKVDKGINMMKQHQLIPQQTLMIGDTLHDFEVAKAMGVSCVLVADGHQSEERLKSGVGAANVITQLSALNNWLYS